MKNLPYKSLSHIISLSGQDKMSKIPVSSKWPWKELNLRIDTHLVVLVEKTDTCSTWIVLGLITKLHIKLQELFMTLYANDFFHIIKNI